MLILCYHIVLTSVNPYFYILVVALDIGSGYFAVDSNLPSETILP